MLYGKLPYGMMPFGEPGYIAYDSEIEAGAAADVATGPSAYSGAITNALAGSEAPTATQVSPVAQVEAGAAVDTPTGPVAWPAAIADAGAAADVSNAIVTNSTLNAETLAGTDSPATTVVLVAAQVEAGAATDTPNAGAVHPSALVEAGTASDSVNGPAAHPGDLPTAVNSVDTVTAAMAATGARVEIGSAVDSPAATQVSTVAILTTGAALEATDALKGVLIESALIAADSLAGVSVLVVAVAQSLPPTDIPSAVYSTTQSLAEGIAVSDVSDAAATARGRLDEVANLSSILSGTWGTLVNVSQGLVAAEVVRILGMFFSSPIAEQTSSPTDVLAAIDSLPVQIASALAGTDAVTGITLVRLIEAGAASDVVIGNAGFFRAFFEFASADVVLVASAQYAAAIAQALAATDLEDAFITLTGLGTIVVTNRARYSAKVSTQNGEEA